MVPNTAVGLAKDVTVKAKVADRKRELAGIVAQAPCRADLAGSTMDLWPLYLFHPGAATVNFAVSILTTCRITPLPGKDIHLRSLDGRREERFASLDELCRAKKYRQFRPTGTEW